MEIEPGTPLRYGLPGAAAGGGSLALNDLLGEGIELQPTGRCECRGCARSTARRFGGGYCYGCFKRLARCDLCMVAPQRCHYDQGTCREPDWGARYCMQPHTLYLANTSGPKVGLTRATRLWRRWADQGAAAGVALASATSRRAAGEFEARLAQHINDRTNWQTLVAGRRPEADLPALAADIRRRWPIPGAGCSYLDRTPVTFLEYPMLAPPAVNRLTLSGRVPVRGRLVGMIGQYLLLDGGVLSVAAHAGVEITWRRIALPPPSPLLHDQLELLP